MRILAAGLLAAAAVTASEPAWSGVVAAGPATSAHATVSDGAGGTLAVTVHFPAAGSGPWPVIVFSHGLGGSRDGYAFLGSHWAAHGYVSIHPTHPGSDGSIFRGGLAGVGERLRAATRDPEVLRSRPRQIGAVLDGLTSLEQQVPALAGRLDAANCGVAGHSFGAWTTLMCAGVRSLLGDASDPRPRACIALSPPGPGARTPEGAYAGATRPLLIVTGSDDRQPAVIDPDPTHDGRWRASVFDRLPAGNAALAWLDGANHSTFSGGAGAQMLGDPPPTPEHLAAVRDLTLAWWDWRLRGSATAAEFLRNRWAPGVAGARLTEK